MYNPSNSSRIFSCSFLLGIIIKLHLWQLWAQPNLLWVWWEKFQTFHKSRILFSSHSKIKNMTSSKQQLWCKFDFKDYDIATRIDKTKKITFMKQVELY
jgi:hypothetical protein